MSGPGPARYLLLNYMKLEVRDVPDVVSVLRQPRPTDARFPRAVYRHEAGDRLMEFVALPDPSGLGDLLGDAAWREVEAVVRPRLSVDYRRQLHELRDVVKVSSPVPDAEHLQLMRSEIAPAALQDYHAWRRDSLFPTVRGHGQVVGFSAYHSVLSTEPGALFLTQLSCPFAEYLERPETAVYQEHLKHAATRFTLGAQHTSNWTRV
ncbi:hypothetical protein [Corallococcus llansteffanensis]|uniref:Uncharacterized protein n=1 Tax=Corallococcus llansteffanensis TaxID=2316731 RepID=A0A3A8QJ33_9BACT|nr:hypothetical protein [Corallococcus llansteffanensis]RKH67898.1 hypothetical protein D7V93_02165 [Corallococcus llansteffanensis]